MSETDFNFYNSNFNVLHNLKYNHKSSVTNTKECLPINLNTSYLSSLLLESSTGLTINSPTRRWVQGFHRVQASTLMASHSHNLVDRDQSQGFCDHPQADVCNIYTSSSDLPNLCLQSSRLMCLTTDQLPFPQATQTQLMMLLPKQFPPPLTLNFW